MNLSTDIQLFNEDFAALLNARQKKAAQTKNPQMEVPAIITKKWLADRMKCTTPSGEVNINRLYNYVLTPDVLAHLGLTVQQVRCKGFKCFDRVQSVRLVQILHL
jgi:hypothetical protein